MTYLERLKKFAIPLPVTDKTDGSPPRNEAGEQGENSAIPLPVTDKTDGSIQLAPCVSSVSPIRKDSAKNFAGEAAPTTLCVSSVSASYGGCVDFSSVRCGECRHSILSADTDPVYGWRCCGLTLEGGGGFARALRRCERWEGRGLEPPQPTPEQSPLAAELAELAGIGVEKLLAGDLSEADWSKITDASAELAQRHHEGRDAITALIGRIDAAYNRAEVSP